MVNEQTKQTPETGDGLSIVDEAKKVRDEIKAENDRREQILAREQRLHAERMLGSSAGQPQPIVPAPVESPKEYAERIMKNKI